MRPLGYMGWAPSMPACQTGLRPVPSVKKSGLRTAAVEPSVQDWYLSSQYYGRYIRLTDVHEERVLWEAEFDPRVRTYWLLSGAGFLTISIVGIVLLPLWFAIGSWATGHYLRRMRCTLSEKTLQVSKGVLQRVEKTVPLDKITDVGIVQGPIMRYLGLEALSVETAGQSSQGALVKLIGIVETRQFRAAILRQRDVVAAGLAEGPRPSDSSLALSKSPSEDLLVDIRDSLRRIEQHLGGNNDG